MAAHRYPLTIALAALLLTVATTGQDVAKTPAPAATEFSESCLPISRFRRLAIIPLFYVSGHNCQARFWGRNYAL